MRIGLKYASPIAQMLLASALLWLRQHWDLAAMRTMDAPGLGEQA